MSAAYSMEYCAADSTIENIDGNSCLFLAFEMKPRYHCLLMSPKAF